MKTYLVIIAHDKGVMRLKVTAGNKQRAILLVMKAENCPSHAILKVSKI